VADPVFDVVTEINRCNQRGGRMLSLVDLLKRDTIDIDAAAFVASRVYRGASFIVGAVPGGAGKTTVMGAFLGFLHPRMRIAACDGAQAIARVGNSPEPCCALAHEISPGPYYCYLWDAELRAYFSLPRRGHMIATNLHADTLAQAREQVCGENGVPPSDFDAVEVFIFLAVDSAPGERRIRVREILCRDPDSGRHVPLSPRRTRDEEARAWRSFLEELLREGVFLLEDVRGRVAAFSPGRKDPSWSGPCS